MIRIVMILILTTAAALGFLVQPLVGKELLPRGGGAPAVWNTCLVLFQALLLLGYTYADRLAGRRPRLHATLMLFVAAIVLARYFFTGSWRPTTTPLAPGYPILDFFLVLLQSVALPYLALSGTSPLVQRWAALWHPGRDPYALSVASNTGSLAGLLAYPLIVEPLFPLGQQWQLWMIFWFAVVLAIALFAFVTPKSPDAERPRTASVAGLQRARWWALSALPSALLVCVTTHLTTDIAPVPLVWITPLVLYLVGFIVAFGYWPRRAQTLLGRFTPMTLCYVLVSLLIGATEPMVLIAL
ncbi:MAG: hypothetical protein ACRCZF_16000, partial [Gemmataceae bacterium]